MTTVKAMLVLWAVEIGFVGDDTGGERCAIDTGSLSKLLHAGGKPFGGSCVGARRCGPLPPPPQEREKRVIHTHVAIACLPLFSCLAVLTAQ